MAAESAQRSEKPTPRKLSEARRRGQIPRSPDLVGWVVVLAASFVVPGLVGAIHTELVGYFVTARELMAAGAYEDSLRLTLSLVRGIGWLLAGFLGSVMAMTAIGMVVQGGVTLTVEPLRPKLERISPKAGIKRLISAQSAVETTKAVLRLGLLGVLVWTVGRSFVADQLGSTVRDLRTVGPELGALLLLVVRLAALLGLVIGLADYGFQRYKIGKQLKMSKHEVKQENRSTDGDPMIKNRRRALHAKVSRNQMLAAVSEASVVVVNPTHVAVALAYSPGSVPTVVAKGGDELAMRIRERAFQAEVPVVEVRPLARILHDALDVGSEVPADMYEAVAIVIAFVMNGPEMAIDRLVRRVNIPRSKLGRAGGVA